MSICPQLEMFTNITALDLSCNCINVYHNDSACDALTDLLSKLCNLVRLDLSNNRIKSKVRRILSDIQKPLEYLRLVGCGLMPMDILYLSVSHHTQALRELDLSENCLASAVRHLTSLLCAVKCRLKVLELEETDLTDAHFLTLSSACLKELVGLMYLNISANLLTQEVIESVCQSTSCLSELQWIILAYPTDCYDFEDEIEDRLKSQFEEKIKRLLADARKLRNINNVPSLVIKELEQNIE